MSDTLNTLPISQQAVVDDVKLRAGKDSTVTLIREHQHTAKPIDFKKGTYAPGNYVHYLTYNRINPANPSDIMTVVFSVYPCGTLTRS